MIVKFLLGASLAVLCAAHVRFTFPPARKYDLDFLDNVRTNGPCGMQSNPGSPLTTFAPGQMVNVTWHLAYAHRGGHRIELLDVNTNQVEYSLTQADQYISQDDSTRTEQAVMIPSDASGRYTMRLLRQASEWTAGSLGQYIFRSCADIHVVAGAKCNTDLHCSGNGICRSGMCECDRLSSGDYCQYTDDCDNSGDCNNNGMCTEVSRTTYPRRQCFCNSGYYGPKCQNKNPADFTMDVKTDNYNKLQLNGDSGDYNLYYRILEGQGEIEVVMDMKGSTWMALGWRPDGMDANCRNYPVPYRDGGSGSGPNTEPGAEPTGEPGAEPTGEPEAEPTGEPEAEPTGEPGAEPTSEPTSEPVSEPSSGKRRRRAVYEGVVNAVMPPNYNHQWTCHPEEGWPDDPTGETEPEPTGETEPEPTGETEPEPTGETEPEPTGETEPEPTGETEPEPTGETEPEPTGETEPEPTGETEPEPTGETEPEPTGETEPEPTGETEPEPTGETEPEPTGETEPEPTGETEPEPTGETEPEPTGETEPEPTGETEPEPTGETEPEPTSEGEPNQPTAGRPHPMDCTDIVIGKILNATSHIADYYTRDRATPRLDDAFWGGMDDLTAAGGMQYTDRTRFVFRKKLTSMEMTDHSIGKDVPMHVIWAHGQEYCKYVHSPRSGIEAMTAKDMFFYPRYELKYHGTSSMNRGQFRGLVLYSDQQDKEGPCVGEYTVPSTCMGNECDYRVSYTFNEDTDEVEFIVESKIMTNYWGGVGFSSSGGMVGSDAVLAWPNQQGMYEVKDMFLGGKSASAVVQDAVQNLKDTEASYENGWLKMKFTRMRKTGDMDQDEILDADNCVHLLMPRSGGSVSNQQLMRHSETPALSSQKVCIQSCSAVATTPSTGDGDGAGSVTGSLLLALLAALMTFLSME